MTNAHKHKDDSQETRLALLEQSIGHVSQALLRIESSIENIENKLTARINGIEARMDKIDNRLWNVGFLIITCSTGLLMTMAKGFHWI